MRVLFVTSEAFPLAKTGGLADVASALPAALRRCGVDARLLLPGYPDALRRLRHARVDARLDGILGIDGALLISGYPPDSSLPVWLVHAPSLYERGGGLYQDSNGNEWHDNDMRFGFLAHVAAGIAAGRLNSWVPDVVHANDWHTGLIPLLLSLVGRPETPTVLTVHNLAFQGNFPPSCLAKLGIPEAMFSAEGIEFYGNASFLKGGIRFADKITTVSPTYASEILGSEFGCGMEGILQDRADDLTGILNGIDSEIWDPATDSDIASTFSAADMSGKRLCKRALQRQCGLEPDDERPVIGFASRLTHQKMADIVLAAIPAMVDAGAQFVAVAEGDTALQNAFNKMARDHADAVFACDSFSEAQAHRLHAGADLLLAPARFEPCGLTQLYAMRYGTVPLVRRTGGLADTVVDASANASLRNATGIAFEHSDLDDLLGAVRRGLALYRNPLAWRRLQQQGMAQDFSWRNSAAKYRALYEAVLSRSCPEPFGGIFAEQRTPPIAQVNV